MIKVFVDSGSSIKQDEKDFYGVEILPLKILLGDKEFLDGVDLSMDTFYSALINDGIFPKTSLPSLEDAQSRVKKCIDEGYDVIILTISTGISGTNNAIRMLFQDEPRVRVIDTKSAVGGMKILALEAKKYVNESLDFVENKLNELIPKIKVLAVPETLAYLHKGGRLSKVSWAVGTVLRIKPVIELKHTVKVNSKCIGLKMAMNKIVAALNNCDKNYPIVPSYTYDTKNLDELLKLTPSEYIDIMIDKDNLDPAIACHWGPNAFGFIFVEKEQNN